MTRRELLAGAAAAGLARDASPPSERIRAGFIGVGNRGSQLLQAAIPNADLEIAALCDVYNPHLERAKKMVGGNPTLYGDFRKVLERKDLDCVFIATPDHWHAIQTIMACDSGKDVYVEKPLSMTVHEGLRMVEAARRNQRIVQVGLMRRSSTLFPQIARLIQGDEIGKVTVARAYRITNMWPSGIGKSPDTNPPPDLDWDMWLGPRPKRAFNPNIAPYKFRWWKAYSSQVANWGAHYYDLIRWLLSESAPVSVSAHGGRFAIDDDRDIPDTLEAIFEFGSGRLMTFGQFEASGFPAPEKREIEMRGTKGCLFADNLGYDIIPERGGQFQKAEPYMKPESVTWKRENMDALHVRNFLDCVKSRHTPNCDVQEGHLSTVFAHLANIALATRSRIEWDDARQRITNNSRANDLLHYSYRPPWKLG